MIVIVIKRAKVMVMKRATGKMEEVRMLERTKSRC